MKSRTILMALFVLSFFVRGASAQNKSYLSHIVNGNYGSGTYRMTFVLFNNTDTDTSALLELTDDNGAPLVLTIGGTTNSSFTIQLPAGSSQTLQSDGRGNVVVGAATVTCAANIGVSAIFSIYNANGDFITETGVGDSEPLTSFVLPVDTTGLFNTGLALFNVGSASVNVVMTLRNTNGQQVGSNVEVSLAGHNHLARFISGAGQLFPAVSNFQGTLLVQCATPIAALVLRENASPLSFTSLPAVSTASTRTTLNLAQVANGSYGSGSYKTSFLIFNISAVATNVTLTLTSDNGTPLSVTIPGQGTNSSFSFPNLAPGASLFLQTDGLGSVASGAATITSFVPIGASAVFTVLNSHGDFQTETGVGDSPVLSSLTVPVDIEGNSDTGIAFFAAGGSSPTLTFRLLDSTGTPYGSSVAKNLPSKGHLAVFVDQLFTVTSATNGSLASTGGFKGSLAITSTSGVAALTLRQNDSPLAFTTLPVVSGTSKGQTSSAPGGRLLSKTESGIDATGNVVKDETLSSGFRLTGVVSGPGVGKTVTASTGNDQGYSGPVIRKTGAYSILLPAGTYTVRVGFTPNTVPAADDVSVGYTVPGSLQVSGDTTLNITLPPVAVYSVSGTVTGLSNIPHSTTPVLLQFGSTEQTGAQGSIKVNGTDGSYQGVLPADNYSVSLSASWAVTGFQFDTLGLLEIGSASISGNTVLPPYNVPATAKLSGTVHGLGVTPIASQAGVAATNALATITGSALSGAGGAYQAVVPKNINYNVAVGAALTHGSTVWGSFAFPLAPDGKTYGNSIDLSQDTANFDFTVPPLPPQVTISGHVRDGSGQPVANVTITAGSFSISGGQIITFDTFGTTDASGFYSLTVFSGTEYSMSFLPPAQ